MEESQMPIEENQIQLCHAMNRSNKKLFPLFLLNLSTVSLYSSFSLSPQPLSKAV